MGEEKRRRAAAAAAGIEIVPKDKKLFSYTVVVDPDTEGKMREEYKALVAFNESKDPSMKTPPLEACLPQWIEFGLLFAKHARLQPGGKLIESPKLVVSPYA